MYVWEVAIKQFVYLHEAALNNSYDLGLLDIKHLHTS